MAKAQIFDARSGDTSSLDLEGPRFTTEPNEHVIHRAVVAELDSRRRYTASTKGRSEVRGSGAKLYRQKGTGRARAGDAKSPIRQGGGTWGGPKAKPARYGKRINRKEATAAFDGALSAKAQDGELYVLDSLAFHTPSTKQAKELLSRMELEGPVLVVLTESDANAALSFRNLPRVSVVGPNEYGVYELLRAREVVFSRAAYSRLAGKESYNLIETEGQYTFHVDRRANKNQIKRAVEGAFDVSVQKVNTVNVKSKPKRQGLTRGRTPTWKKAVVKLAEGERIELFEGV